MTKKMLVMSFSGLFSAFFEKIHRLSSKETIKRHFYFFIFILFAIAEFRFWETAEQKKKMA
jgi:hypothetical protein